MISYINDVTIDNAEVLVEYGSDGLAKNTYQYGLERLSTEYGNSVSQYFLYNGTGSVVQTSESNGSLALRYTYDPFGTPSVRSPALLSLADTTSYTYNGESYNYTTGLQYLRARYYNTSTGSFISQDTYLGDTLNPLSQNRYTYCHNNPVMYDDPSGHCTGTVGESDLCSDPSCPYNVSFDETSTSLDKNTYIGNIIAEAISKKNYKVDCNALYNTLSDMSVKELALVWVDSENDNNYTDRLMDNLSDNSDIYVAGAILSQADGPSPAVDILVIAGLVLFTIYLATISIPDSSIPYIDISIPSQSMTSEEIGKIAGKYGNYKCKEAAKAIQSELEKRNQHGKIVTIKYPTDPGFIVSDTYGSEAISTNGVHVGVLYNGRIYCNIHPYGLEQNAWLNDFHGIGPRTVTYTPF